MNRKVDKVWESQQLPDHPLMITFRGRYSHADKKLAELLKLDEHRGASIRVLDVGCGVLTFGSPTMHDIYEMFVGHGIKPTMVGVDTKLPPDLKPFYPAIRYKTSLTSLRGIFDIVRMFHLVEHMSGGDYNALRSKALSHLRHGGMFMTTQKLEYYSQRKDDWYLLNPTIKMAQKTASGIEAIELLPEVLLPDWVRGNFFMGEESIVREYSEHRTAVADGREKIPLTLDIEGCEKVYRHLVNLKTDVLRYESRWREHERHDPSDFLATDKHELQEYFAHSEGVTERFWAR